MGRGRKRYPREGGYDWRGGSRAKATMISINSVRRMSPLIERCSSHSIYSKWHQCDHFTSSHLVFIASRQAYLRCIATTNFLSCETQRRRRSVPRRADRRSGLEAGLDSPRPWAVGGTAGGGHSTAHLGLGILLHHPTFIFLRTTQARQRWYVFQTRRDGDRRRRRRRRCAVGRMSDASSQGEQGCLRLGKDIEDIAVDAVFVGLCGRPGVERRAMEVAWDCLRCLDLVVITAWPLWTASVRSTAAHFVRGRGRLPEDRACTLEIL